MKYKMTVPTFRVEVLEYVGPNTDETHWVYETVCNSMEQLSKILADDTKYLRAWQCGRFGRIPFRKNFDKMEMEHL